MTQWTEEKKQELKRLSDQFHQDFLALDKHYRDLDDKLLNITFKLPTDEDEFGLLYKLQRDDLIDQGKWWHIEPKLIEEKGTILKLFNLHLQQMIADRIHQKVDADLEQKEYYDRFMQLSEEHKEHKNSEQIDEKEE